MRSSARVCHAIWSPARRVSSARAIAPLTVVNVVDTAGWQDARAVAAALGDAYATWRRSLRAFAAAATWCCSDRPPSPGTGSWKALPRPTRRPRACSSARTSRGAARGTIHPAPAPSLTTVMVLGKLAPVRRVPAENEAMAPVGLFERETAADQALFLLIREARRRRAAPPDRPRARRPCDIGRHGTCGARRNRRVLTGGAT